MDFGLEVLFTTIYFIQKGKFLVLAHFILKIFPGSLLSLFLSKIFFITDIGKQQKWLYKQLLQQEEQMMSLLGLQRPEKPLLSLENNIWSKTEIIQTGKKKLPPCIVPTPGTTVPVADITVGMAELANPWRPKAPPPPIAPLNIEL